MVAKSVEIRYLLNKKKVSVALASDKTFLGFVRRVEMLVKFYY